MPKKKPKYQLLRHSQAKVRLLQEYLKRYLNIICNDGYTDCIYIYDLFCGPGIYEDGGEGSPLIIMRSVKDIHFSNVAKLSAFPKMNCLFNDLDESRTKSTQKAISDKSLYYPAFGDISYSSKEYNILLEELYDKIKTLNKEKIFVFIDPYEYKHIKLSHIRSLLAGKKTEVLLWLPTQFMYRFESNGTPTALKDFIEEITPYQSWKGSDNARSFIEQIRDGFQIKLGNDFFVDTFTIQKDRGTIFSLFFFTSHIRGFEKMLEAKWEIDSEQGKGWEYHGNALSLFYDQKTNPLESKLVEFLENRPKSNGEIYEYTLRQGFLPKHTNEILYNWQKNGRISVTLRNGEKARKAAFYISYKQFKEDYSKVSIARV